MHSLIDAIVDAADAPHLRAQVAELETKVRRQDGIIAELTRQLELERNTAIFYYDMHAAKPLKMAEDAWEGVEMDMEREMDRLQDENAALRGALTDRDKIITEYRVQVGNWQQQHFDAAQERDALRAWKDAVPVDDIRCIAQDEQLQSWWEIKALNRWLASLDGAA